MSSPQTDLHIFGIRHHGPGSARSLRRALSDLRPDCILVEGPPDAEAALPLLGHAEMKPPVALLVYDPEKPGRAVYYPFAVFSPEWQAIHYGLSYGLPVRFMDLPQAHRFALVPEEEEAPLSGSEPAGEIDPEFAPEGAVETGEEVPVEIRRDPLGWLAEAAGFSDGERWWEHMVEHRLQGEGIFEAILEMMAALREETPAPDDPSEAEHEARREAYMRKVIRAARGEGYERIAVVCGAWHAPALATMPPEKQDAALLKRLPSVKVQATWVPWTYSRLSYFSGYGAGIESPGWYHHLWRHADGVSVRWLTRVAHLLREEDLDASTAHVIETVRLAETLAALRGRPLPALADLNEAVLAVMLFGNEVPLRLIHDKLIVGEVLGSVPDDTPMVPLQLDLVREQRRLRLPAEAAVRTLDLDLRKEGDLERSRLLHRLSLLGIPWGQAERVGARVKGTFHEVWQLQWQPELAVLLIEAGGWGNTVFDAATAYVRDAAERASDLPTLTRLVDGALLADLPDAVSRLMERLQAAAALASDVGHLMDALPPLAGVLRYSNVRRTDAGIVAHVVDGLVARICIGLPGACASLNDEAAEEMYSRVMAAHGAISLLQNDEHVAAWHGVLAHLADQRGIHGLVAGRACRLLLDAQVFNAEETARRMGLALSTANEPAQAAAWVDGMLRGSGIALLHDQALWQVLDDWVSGLSPDNFTAVLPLLRRTFSTFPAPERRNMGERALHGKARPESAGDVAQGFDSERARAVLPLVARLLGLEYSVEK